MWNGNTDTSFLDQLNCMHALLNAAHCGQVHVATHNAHETSTLSVCLTKGVRDRTGEDAAASTLVIQALARACGIDAGLDLSMASPLSAGGGSEEIQAFPCMTEAENLIGQRDCKRCEMIGRWRSP